jgi:hypothetical protein
MTSQWALATIRILLRRVEALEARNARPLANEGCQLADPGCEILLVDAPQYTSDVVYPRVVSLHTLLPEPQTEAYGAHDVAELPACVESPACPSSTSLAAHDLQVCPMVLFKGASALLRCAATVCTMPPVRRFACRNRRSRCYPCLPAASCVSAVAPMLEFGNLQFGSCEVEVGPSSDALVSGSCEGLASLAKSDADVLHAGLPSSCNRVYHDTSSSACSREDIVEGTDVAACASGSQGPPSSARSSDYELPDTPCPRCGRLDVVGSGWFECCGIAYGDSDDGFLDSRFHEEFSAEDPLAAFPRRPMKKYKFLHPGTLDTCRHGECRELRRRLAAGKKLTCAVCAFDHAQRVCSSVYCDAPIVFVRGWHGGWEFKVLGNFVHDPPDASRGEALRCVPCHSSFVGPGNSA